jgi:zinc protease
MRLIWIMAVATLVTYAGSGDADAKAAPRVAVSFSEVTLSNGLRVILSEDHSAPVIALNVTYDVGSRNEQAGRTGFAHLFEHMMFKGSQNVGTGEHFYQIYTNGGTMNGSTSEDRTNYFETLPANQLEMALYLEADRMRSLAINQKNLDNQRNAVQEERRQSVDNQPYGKGEEIFQALIYDNFAYKHSTIGSMDDLNAATVVDVEAFFTLYYAPNNAVMSLVGDFKSADALRLIKKLFGDIKRQPAPPGVDMSEPKQTAERREVIPDTLARLPDLNIAYKGIVGNTPDFYALQVLSSVLQNGQSSRLYQSLVQDKALVSSVSSQIDERRGVGAFYIDATPLPGKKSEDVEAAIYAEIDRLQREPVADWELQKASNLARLSYLSRIRSAQSRATQLSLYKVFYNDPNLLNTRLDKLKAVTREDLKRVAQQYLQPAMRTVVLITPQVDSPAPASQKN